MADLGKSMMPQFDHKEGEIVDVSPVCAHSAVSYGIASYVVEKAEANPALEDKAKAEGSILESLRDKARSMGIPRAGNMGEDKLLEEIERKEAE